MGFDLAMDIVPGLLGGGVTLDAYILAQSNLLYYKFNEGSGALIDYGSEGADGTVTGATQAQAGIAGLGAYLLDGIDDLITVSNASLPNVKGLSTQSWGALVKILGDGESTGGRIFQWSFAGYNWFCAPTKALRASIDTDATSASSVSNDNQISDIHDNWSWIFMDYDHAGDKKIKLYKGINGTLTELTYASQVAATGTVVTNAVDLIIGNNPIGGVSFYGYIAALVCRGTLYTTDEKQTMINLGGV